MWQTGNERAELSESLTILTRWVIMTIRHSLKELLSSRADPNSLFFAMLAKSKYLFVWVSPNDYLDAFYTFKNILIYASLLRRSPGSQTSLYLLHQ